MTAPTTSTEFDQAYQAPFTLWGDVRIPRELIELVARSPHTALELGSGVGRFSRFMARQGVKMTGVDFSAVAVTKARERVAEDEHPAEFLVGDVTHLDALSGPFDAAFDVGCFHCLAQKDHQAYVAELSRLLPPGGLHLIWALDRSPSGLDLSPAVVQQVFASGFELRDAQPSRRRLARSHWYWLVRSRA